MSQRIAITDAVTMRRFIAKFTIGDGCWEWTAAGARYGRWHGGGGRSERKQLLAHRVAYATFVGPIPDGKQIHHSCFNQKCVRPDHLAVVTPRENLTATDGPMAPGKHHDPEKDHCHRGHEYTEENTYRYPDSGYRRCRTCHADNARRYRQGKGSLR